jgi:hypothetical protein
MGGIQPRDAVHAWPERASAFSAAGAAPKTPDRRQERHKALSMSGFREPGFADRQKAAQQAKKNLLEKFRSQPGADDPAVAARRAEREAIVANREKTRLAREAEKVEARRREEEAAAAEAARVAREKEEETARLAALEAEQKAKRDARYAARKDRGKKKK